MTVRTEFIQVSTTADSKERANQIAIRLLKQRVATCVQVFGPIRSSYWWNGKIEHAKEWYCLIKARAKDYPLIEASIRRSHSYKVPEILATPITDGDVDYLRWLRAETTRKSGKTLNHQSPKPNRLQKELQREIR